MHLKLEMDTTKKYCPNCSQLYVLGTSHSKGDNLPLFLTCGHTMCEKCIRNIVKFREPIECKVCHRDMALDPDNVPSMTQKDPKLYEFFPLNIHMLGELYIQNLQKTDQKSSSDDYYLNLKALLKEIENAEGECLECHTPTSKMCEQCRTPICDTCFNKTHKNFVIFKNHFLKNIAPVGVPNDCSIHKGKQLDYYCKDCSKAVCMDCMMVGGTNSCKNHNIVSIQEVNEQKLEELSNISPKIDETFRRLTKTAVDIGLLLYNIENDTQAQCAQTKMIADLEQHFSQLDCQLQKHKQELISLLHKYKSCEKESLVKARSDVADSIKKAKTVMNTITATNDPKFLKEVNLTALLQNAKEVVDIPWHLTKEKVKDEPLKLIVNEELCSKISEYVRIEGKCNSSYKLQSTKELGEEDIPAAPPAPVLPPEMPKDVRLSGKSKQAGSTKSGEEPPYVAFYKNVPHYRAKSESVTSLNSISSESSYKSTSNTRGDVHNKHHNRPMIQPVSPFPESQHPSQLVEGSQVVIYISHIIDPHNFFVQRSNRQNEVKEIIRAFRNAASLPKPSVSHVAREKVYLVYNKADNLWQRCRVVDIDRKDVNKPVFQVFCFDFGSTEKVHVDELRLIPPARLQNPPPLAIHCSLANCEPKAGGWTCDDAYLIRNIIDNKQAVINIRRITQTSKVECDVTTYEDGISLAHALVFHDRARLVNARLPYPKISCAMEQPKIFINNSDLKYKMVEQVYIINVRSPDKFFVRKQHLQEVFEKLCEDLDQEYSVSDITGSIYLPEVDMVCAVNLDRYSEAAGQTGWARCLVTETPGRGRVRVLLVDSGVSLLVHWSQLRRLHKRFTTAIALATECHLAGVTPQNKKWNLRSVALLQQYSGVLLEMKVEDDRNRSSVGVSLYDKSDEENVVCINQEMIRQKYAVSFGLYSFNKNPIVENEAITNRAPVEKKPTAQKNKNSVTVLQKPTATKKKINEKDLEAKDKGPVSLEAKVLHYQSPSLIYISLVQQQQVFNELFEKIQKYYASKKSPGKEDWKVGDRCCTICNASQTWRRGLIVELEGTNAKIFYSDFACAEKVPKAKLFELTPEFASIGDAAIKCHLSGVVPAVGNEWPSLTKEFLKELLDVYKRIFITKVGNFNEKDKSLPIQIWVYHVIQGGALEPDKSEWRCLNKRIIEQGLGVPDKSQEGGATERSEADSDMLSFLNVTGSVTSWLQLEPARQPEPAKAEHSSNASTTAGGDDGEDSPIQSNTTMYITDWLPAEPLQCKEFTAVPTYVDNNGIIYLHDISQTDTLELIRKALDVRFKDSDPKAKYAKWSIGEPCIALYYLDNKFYRGRVLEVCKETSTCLIHYVDYGNEELCSFENLRKSIVLYQLPIQAHKCMLSRIKPAGEQWDRLALDYMHKSVVEKQCFVRVTGEPVGDVIPIDLKYDKLWINDHLVEFEMAKYTDGTMVKVPKFVSKIEQIDEILTAESDSGPDYIIADEDDTPAHTSTSYNSFNIDSMEGKDWNQILEEEEMEKTSPENCIIYPKNTNEDLQCNVTVINDINYLELSIIHDDDTSLIYTELYEDINKNSENMSPLNGIFEDKACIAIFPDDEKWYRASIIQFSESKNQVKVRYVDYGNISVISLADVREIDKEWAKLPPATVMAKIHGYKLNPSVDLNLATTEFAKTFLDQGPFKAKILTYEDSVPLVELRNSNLELTYADLIKKEILTPC